MDHCLFERSQHVRIDDRSEPRLDATTDRRRQTPRESGRPQGCDVPGGHQLGAVFRHHGALRGQPLPVDGVRRVHVRGRGHPRVRPPVLRGHQRVRGQRAPGIRMRLASRGRAPLHLDQERSGTVPK